MQAEEILALFYVCMGKNSTNMLLMIFLVCTPADVMKDTTETVMERDTRPF